MSEFKLCEERLQELEEELSYAGDAIKRFVSYARQYPEDIQGPLADDFLPLLERAALRIYKKINA